jgi:ATP/maltotriose-dependent transcriptional regulator MalT
VGVAWANLALVACTQGDYSTARTAYIEGLTLARELDNWECDAWALEGVAGLAVAQERPEQAVRLLAAAETLREAINVPLPPVNRPRRDRILADARSRLGEAASTTAWAAGRALSAAESLDEALAYVAEPIPSTDAGAAPGESHSDSPAGSRPVDLLTAREREVLALVAEGLSNKEIATRLVLSPLTVRTHLESIFRKLNTPSRTAAVHAARIHGLL